MHYVFYIISLIVRSGDLFYKIKMLIESLKFYIEKELRAKRSV